MAEVRKSGERCLKVMESGEKWGKFLQLSSLCFFTVVVGWMFYSCRQISFFTVVVDFFTVVVDFFLQLSLFLQLSSQQSSNVYKRHMTILAHTENL